VSRSTALILAAAIATPLTACESGPKKPGEEALESAGETAKNKASLYSGNNDGCTQRARVASEVLTDWRTKVFSDNDGLKFRVHCHESEHGMAFIVYVPKLKQYKDVRGDLAQLGWAAAQLATSDLAEDNAQLQLGLGMRGELFFGVVGVGLAGTTPEFDLSKIAKEEPLFPFFAAPGVSGEPLPETVADMLIGEAKALADEG
jgi:hypothetical protein